MALLGIVLWCCLGAAKRRRAAAEHAASCSDAPFDKVRACQASSERTGSHSLEPLGSDVVRFFPVPPDALARTKDSDACTYGESLTPVTRVAGDGGEGRVLQLRV